MGLNANAIVTVAEAAQALGIAEGSLDNFTIERLINSLTYTFETVTGRAIKQRTLTNYRVDGNGCAEMYLPFAPVQSITKIDIRYRDETVYKAITDTSKFIIKSAKRGLVYLKEDIFICGTQNVLMTMSVGFLSTDMEMDTAKDLLLTQLKTSYGFLQASEAGVASRTYADGSISFFPPNRLLKEVRDGLSVLQDWQLT